MFYLIEQDFLFIGVSEEELLSWSELWVHSVILSTSFDVSELVSFPSKQSLGEYGRRHLINDEG